MQIFVLGMHRSGTSVVTRLITLMGANFGSESLNTGANPENPTGFWERRDVRVENDAVLRSANADWWKVADFNLDQVPDDASERFDANVQKIVHDLDNHRPWVVKEPRLCLLFPMWRRHVEKPVCVLVHRSPIQIAHSLERRNGFPLSFGVALWERYVLDSISASADLPRIFVSYEQIMADPVGQADRMLHDLTSAGVDGLYRPQKADIESFVSSDLFHHRHSDEEELRNISPAQRDLATAMASGDAIDFENIQPLSAQTESTLRLFEETQASRNLIQRERETSHRQSEEIESLCARLNETRKSLDRARHAGRSRAWRLKQVQMDLDSVTARAERLEAARDRETFRASELQTAAGRLEHEIDWWLDEATKARSHQRKLEQSIKDLLLFLRKAQIIFETIVSQTVRRVGPLELWSRRQAEAARNHLTLLFREIGKWVGKRKSEFINMLGERSPAGAQFHPAVDGESTGRPNSMDVIVCVHDALDEVRRCLSSVISTLRSHHTLIIVDDGSAEDTARFLRCFAQTHHQVRLIRRETAGGYTKAANRGLNISTAEFVILLNSDTRVSKDWWKKLTRAAYTSTNTGIVGPLSNAASWQSVPEIIDENGNFAVNEIPAGLTVEDMDRIAESCSPEFFPRVDLANGFCLGVKRAVLDTVGQFDEESFPRGYGEENDFCLRAIDAGFDIVIATDCYVYHEKSKSYSSTVRDRLAKDGASILQKKYPPERIRKSVEDFKENPILVDIRERFGQEIRNAVESGVPDDGGNRKTRGDWPSRILFVLPVKGGGGGVHSVVQETIGIRELGAHASIAVPGMAIDRYHERYPNVDPSIFVGFDDVEELTVTAREYDVVVATIFTSVRLLQKVIQAVPNLVPAYYIQDYEPWICRGDQLLEREAFESYRLIHDIIRFSKTDWLRHTVEEKHGVPVHKVMPSLDTSVYFPPSDDEPHVDDDRPVSIAAMVRPKTPRRAAGSTMEILSCAKKQYGDSVRVTIFGCDPEEKDFLGLCRDFEYQHLGVLSREEVAATLRKSDVFVDFSTYQAFGRTALEAMACGCAVIVPEFGGTSEYAENNENSLVVDTADRSSCVAAMRILVEDRALRERLAKSAISTAARYSIRGAAASILGVLSGFAPERSNHSV